MGQKRVFEYLRKCSHFFLHLVYNESLYYSPYTCANPTLGNLFPEIWTKMPLVNQIAGFLNQLYLQNKMIKKPVFCACLYRILETKSWLKNIEVGLIKNGRDHFGPRALKFAVSQEEINGINIMEEISLVCWYKFRQKRYFNNFWVVLVKNRCELLGLGFLKSVVS